MHDAIVVGAGLAGGSAALRLRESGLSVLLIADGQGATALSTGAVAPDPALGPDDLPWLAKTVRGALEFAGGRVMRIPAATGAVLEALAAPPGCLDLGAAPGRRIAIVAPTVSGAPTAADLAGLLGAAAGRSFEFLPFEVPSAPRLDDVLLSPDAVLGRMRSDPARIADLAAAVRRSVEGVAADAVLLPSFVPFEACEAVRASTGRPAFRLLGTWALAPSGRGLADAVALAVRESGADVSGRLRAESVHAAGGGWSVCCCCGARFEARCVVAATGGPAGGGTVKHGRIAVSPDAGVATFATGPLPQSGASIGPAPGAFLPSGMFDGPGAADAGFEVDDGMRVAGAANPGLFAAGAAGRRPGRTSIGLGWALASGLLAARSALEHSR